jgi:glycosyltransferase involved in cell wall biosynthesis
MNLPRRVLHVENGIGYGGAIICLRHLVRGLDPARYEAHVVTGRDDEPYRDIARDAPWHPIRDRRFDAPGLSRAIEAAWFAHIKPLRWLLLQLVARCDDLCNFLPFFLRLLHLALTLRPALIHVNNEPMCNRAALLVARILRIPAICHVRGEQRGGRLLHWLYGIPDHFIPVSHWIARSIHALGVPMDKQTVVYDGIALDDLDLHADGAHWRRQHGIPSDGFCVGLVGLLIPWKGQQLFLDAALLLRARIPALRMLVIGGTPEECGHYEQALRSRVHNEGLDDLVQFIGHQSEMAQVYNALDVVVSASTTPEPLGTMVIECMTMARPLIVPAHGGGAEMTTHDVTALWFQPGDAKALAETIERLYHEPALRTRLGHTARSKALATFDIAAHASGVQAVYDRVLEDRP